MTNAELPAGWVLEDPEEVARMGDSGDGRLFVALVRAPVAVIRHIDGDPRNNDIDNLTAEDVDR